MAPKCNSWDVLAKQGANVEIYNAMGPLRNMGMFFTLVKYGGGIIGATGSIAGTVHARNRFGNYIRARTKPVNPNSTAQCAVRSCFAQLAAYWRDTCTPAERIAWATYASAIAMKNRLGETVYMTGFNHFLRCNSIYLRQTALVESTGPTTLALPEKDSTLSMTALVSDQSLHVTFNDSSPWRLIADSMMVVFMGTPQNITRNFFNGPWKLAGGISAVNPSPKTIAAPFTLVLGQKVWAYARILTGPTDMRLSEPMTISCTVTAGP